MNRKKEILAKILSFGILFLIFGISYVGAQTIEGTTGSGISLSNPLKADSFTKLADNIIDFLIKIGGPIAVIMVIWSGFLFMKSGGNEEKITQAKSTLTWTVVGLAVLIVAKSVTLILNQLFSSTGS